MYGADIQAWIGYVSAEETVHGSKALSLGTLANDALAPEDASAKDRLVDFRVVAAHRDVR